MLCSEQRQLLENTHLLGMHIQKTLIFFKEANEVYEDVKDCILYLLKLNPDETALAKSGSSDKVGSLSGTVWEMSRKCYLNRRKGYRITCIQKAG